MHERNELGAEMNQTCAHEALKQFSMNCAVSGASVHSVGQVAFVDQDTLEQHEAVVYPASRGQRHLVNGYTSYIAGVVSVFQ